MKLILPCLYHTDETKSKEDAGLDIDNDEFDIRRAILYSVSLVVPVVDKGKVQNTKIYSGESSIEVPMKMKEVEALIDRAINNSFPVDGFAEWKEKTHNAAGN